MLRRKCVPASMLLAGILVGTVQADSPLSVSSTRGGLDLRTPQSLWTRMRTELPDWQLLRDSLSNQPTAAWAQFQTGMSYWKDESQRWKTTLREAVIKRADALQRGSFGITFDNGWQKTSARLDVVVLVHGFNSRPAAAESLLDGARHYGLPCALFAYPNDQPIEESAQLLARELRQLAKQHPHRGVSLLTYSMGGLVARAAIEDPQIDPGNVRRLIMVAPPNQGTSLAHGAVGVDLYEYFSSRQRRQRRNPIFAAIEDGLAEAVRDLQPGSHMLQRLNSRPIHPEVHYSILLGSGGPIRSEDVDCLRTLVRHCSPSNSCVRDWGDHFWNCMDHFEELVEGKGDGVVSLRRGRLSQVEDTVVLDFNHLGILHEPRSPRTLKLHAEIDKRLKVVLQ